MNVAERAVNTRSIASSARLVVIAAGLRVHVVRPRLAAATRGNIFQLPTRNPFRRPPPDIEDDLPSPLEPEAHRSIAIDPMPPNSQYRAVWTLAKLIRFVLRRFRLKL